MAVGCGATVCALGGVALLALGIAASVDKHVAAVHWSDAFFQILALILLVWAIVSMPYMALRLWDLLGKDQRRSARLRHDIELANAARSGFDIAREAAEAKAALAEQQE